MKKETHQIISIGLAILIGRFLKYDIITFAIFLALSWSSGMLPDVLDWKYLGTKHRGYITHSPITFMILMVFTSIWFILSFFEVKNALVLSIYVVVFYELHIVLDSLNPSGIPIFPGGKTYTFNICNSNNFEVNALITIIGIFLGYVGIFWI